MPTPALHVSTPLVNVAAMHTRLSGLYVITRPLPGGGSALADAVRRAIAGGATLVQYRDKSRNGERRRAEASAVLEACRVAGVPLIINDDCDLAARVGADGVHLGATDASPGEARDTLGSDTIIGVSCYNELERAIEAEAAGASYVAFGSFFPSSTKPNAVRAHPELLREARHRLSIPICAIGGITAENGAELVKAGADMLAVLSGVFECVDPEEVAGRYAALFSSQRKTQGA